MSKKRPSKAVVRLDGAPVRWSWALGVLLAVVPLFEGGNAMPAYVLAFVLAIPAAALLLWKRRRPLDLLDAAVFLLLVYAVVAAFFSAEKYRSLVWALNYASFAAAYVIAREVGRKAAVPVLVGAAVGSACVSLYGLYLFWGSDDPTYRVVSIFGLHNPIAGFYLLTLPVIAALALTLANARAKALLWLAFAASLVAFILSYSRAGWLVGIVEGIAFLVVLAGVALKGASSKRMWATVGLPIGVLALVAAFVRLALPKVFASLVTHVTTISNSQDYSFIGRKVFNGISLKIFATHPVFGSGFDTYRYVINRFQTDFRFYSTDPHNVYLQMLAEGGVIAGIIFLALLVCVAVSIVRAVRSRDIVSIGVAAGVFGLFLHLAVDFDISYVANGLILFAFIGVIAADFAPLRQALSHVLRWLSVAALAFAFVFGLLYVREQGMKDAIPPETADFDLLPTFQKIAAGMPWDHERWLDMAVITLRYDTFLRGSLVITDVEKMEPKVFADVDEFTKKAIALCPDDARAFFMRAVSVDKLGRTADAEPLLREAIRLDPVMHPNYYLFLADVLWRQQKIPECRQVLLDCVQKIPVEYPVTPEFVRPEWVSNNPVFYQIYRMLSVVSALLGDRAAKDKYWDIGRRFFDVSGSEEPQPYAGS